MYSDIILKSAVYERDKELIEQSPIGILYLWSFPDNFEVKASACITLEELFERWPSKRDFIVKAINKRGFTLAGVQATYDDKNSYECKPIYKSGLEYLTISEHHPEYLARYVNSVQAFQEEHDIKFFVLPKDYVERYEREHPEVLRPMTLDTAEEETMVPLPEEFKKAVKIIRKLPLSTMPIGEQNLCIVELLATAGVPSRILYPLITTRFPKDDSGNRTGIRRGCNPKLGGDIMPGDNSRASIWNTSYSLRDWLQIVFRHAWFCHG